MEKIPRIYDLIIVGAGPAGITAAIYAARKKMDFVVLATNVGGQVVLSSRIENYTGFQYITGEELAAKFQEHLEKYKFDLKLEEVKKIEREGNLFKAITTSGIYVGKTIIIATGRKPKELKVLGEKEFRNRGVTYCATCDAPFFENMDVAVVGGGNAGLETVLQLIKIANKIYLIEISSQLKADVILVEKAIESGKLEVLTETRVTEIVGNKTVTGIKVQRNRIMETLPVQGVFVEIGSVPNSDVIGFVDKNEWGEIIVNSQCETNVAGCYAAGDVTNVPEKQIIIAAGEGCKAALSAFRNLTRKNEPC